MALHKNYYEMDGDVYCIENPEELFEARCLIYKAGEGWGPSKRMIDVLEYGDPISEAEYKEFVIKLRTSR